MQNKMKMIYFRTVKKISVFSKKKRGAKGILAVSVSEPLRENSKLFSFMVLKGMVFCLAILFKRFLTIKNKNSKLTSNYLT